MVGRPIEFDQEMVLESAMQLFWTKGYEISSLQMLLNTMNISKSSFYQTFESKKSLFQQCLLRYRKTLAGTLDQRKQNIGNGKLFITSLFFDLALDTNSLDSKRGCFLMNTANEFGQTDCDISALVKESMNELTGIFEQSIVKAQESGEIPKEKDAHRLALYFISSISGIKNMIKAGASEKDVEKIVETLLVALD